MKLEVVRDKILRKEFARMADMADKAAESESGQQGLLADVYWCDSTDQWLHDTKLTHFLKQDKMILHQPTDRYVLFRSGEDACAVCQRTSFLKWMLEDLAST
jgi:hypothetical protein